MAYYDTYNNVQFLDLSGVDEDEKKWILTSLQTCDPCVEGPWNHDNLSDVDHDHGHEHDQLTHPECTIQTHMNNGLPAAMSFEQYPSAPVIISNHVSPISAQVYPQSYQSPMPMYPPAFVPQVQYAAPMAYCDVGPAMVPVPQPYGQPVVTYATYQTPVQANPIYNIPQMVKESPVKLCAVANLPVLNHHQPQPPLHQLQPSLPLHQPTTVHKAPPSAKVQVQVAGNVQVSAKQKQEKLPEVVNGPGYGAGFERPARVASPAQGHARAFAVPVVVPVPNLNPPAQVQVQVQVQTNGHHDQHAHTNGIGSNATSPTSTESPLSEASAVVLSAGKSWAGLFNKNNNKENNVEPHMLREVKSLIATRSLQANADANVVAVEGDQQKSHLAEIGDPNYYRMGEVLINYAPDNKITSLQPRGLINRSNYCYINSILQALLACPPMYNLLSSLGHNVSLKEYRKHTHIIDNMVKFVNEFGHLPAAQRVNRRSDKVQKKEQMAINYDRPFEPNWIYKMLNGIRSDSFVVEGRQEDAEEFLGCLLNGLNDEMLELMKLVVPDAKTVEPIIEDGYKSDSDKEWQVIGPKNKGCITRRTEIVRTPISDIFGGHIRSKLHRAGDLSTNNIQPFFTLQLNIEKVNTVREALEALVCKNQLEGVTSSKTNEEVEAWQQVTIEELPVVLILHLKCFDFKLDGCTKIVKALEFPVDLKIDTKLLSSKTNYQPKEKQYKLFAVVYHDGKEATKGHYLTDAYHVGYASWLRYDDSTVKTVQEEQVLKPHGTRVPYLLFYRRSDTVRNK